MHSKIWKLQVTSIVYVTTIKNQFSSHCVECQKIPATIESISMYLMDASRHVFSLVLSHLCYVLLVWGPSLTQQLIYICNISKAEQFVWWNYILETMTILSAPDSPHYQHSQWLPLQWLIQICSMCVLCYYYYYYYYY